MAYRGKQINLGHITGWRWSNGIAAVRRGEWDHVLCKCYFHISWSADYVVVLLLNHNISLVPIKCKFVYSYWSMTGFSSRFGTIGMVFVQVCGSHFHFLSDHAS